MKEIQEAHTDVGKNSSEIGKLHSIFSKELTPELSEQYLTSLTEKLGGVEQSWETFVGKGEALHQYIGENIYGPLVVGYCNWVKHQCDDIGHTDGNVYFALRDAAPLLAAADILWQGNGLKPVGIFANRPILGIEDEFTPDAESENYQMGLKYLEKHGVHKNGDIIWVDSGAWGTVVKLMKETVLKDTNLYPFFWYSHNPHIPGYLNELQTQTGIPEKTLEILNDSLECMFPQPWQRPTTVMDNGNGPEVILKPSTILSIQWGNAAIDGVTKAAHRLNGSVTQDSEIMHLKLLAELSEQSQKTGEWTGVLPVNTPTWSKGSEFLASWPAELLP